MLILIYWIMTYRHNLTFFIIISIFTTYLLVLLSVIEFCEGMPFAYQEVLAEEDEFSRKFQKLRLKNEHRSRSINPDDNDQTYNNEIKSDISSDDHFVEKHEAGEASTTQITTNETEETTNFNETEVDGNWTTIDSDNYTTHSTSKSTHKPKPTVNLLLKLTKEEVELLKSERLETLAGDFAIKFNKIQNKCTNSSLEDKCFSKNWEKCPENATKILDCFKNQTWGDTCDPIKITSKNKDYSGGWNDTCFTSTWHYVNSDPRKVLECSPEDRKCRCFADESDITRILDCPDYNTRFNTCKIPLHHRCILSKTECDNKWPVIKIECLANNDSDTYSHKDKNAYFCLNAHSTNPHIILIISLGILPLYFHNLYGFHI